MLKYNLMKINWIGTRMDRDLWKNWYTSHSTFIAADLERAIEECNLFQHLYEKD